MKEYIIVDGYNVINNWREFTAVREQNLEHARELLTALVAEFAAFRGLEAIEVFDALEVPGSAESERICGIEVVYTAEGETADSWIERKTYELGRKRQDSIYVVTGDYAEQLNILGSGGYRISAREFHQQYLKAKKEITARLHHPVGGLNRRELGDRVDGSVLERLEQLRRSK